MSRLADKSRKVITSLARQAESFVNGIRFGFIFLRARWFKMPTKIKVAGKQISLHYPPEAGVPNDFFTCVIRNDYGLRHRLPEVRTILDIGANVGFFSIAARARYPRAIIHAYEPNPRVLPFLRTNASGLGIEVYPEAVGAQSGFADIVDFGESNQARTRVADNGEIPLASFDAAVQRLGGSVDLLKLDCEGAEWDLFQLAGAWKHIRNVRMEYHLFRGETVMQVEQALHELGFKVIHLRHEQSFGMLWAASSRAAG